MSMYGFMTSRPSITFAIETSSLVPITVTSNDFTATDPHKLAFIQWKNEDGPTLFLPKQHLLGDVAWITIKIQFRNARVCIPFVLFFLIAAVQLLNSGDKEWLILWVCEADAWLARISLLKCKEFILCRSQK